MYLAGLLGGLVIDALSYLLPSGLKHSTRITIIFMLAIIIFIVSLLTNGFIGIAIGFLSLGIYTTALLLALFGIQASWKKLVYFFVILLVIGIYIFSLL